VERKKSKNIYKTHGSVLVSDATLRFHLLGGVVLLSCCAAIHILWSTHTVNTHHHL